MKKTGTFFFMSMWSFLLTLFATQLSGQVLIPAHNTSVNTNFNGWNGTMPNGFTRSSNNNYMGTSATTTGGVYAIPNMGFGYQPSSNATAMTTSVTGTFRNDTGETITELKITYDAFKIVHRDARIPCWTVNVSSGVFGTNLNWCSDQANTTKTFTSAVSIANGAMFTITLNSDRGTGSQSSPLIGFNNIKVESVSTGCSAPAAPIADPQSFCGEATIADLFADGADLKWYETEDSTTPLALNHILESGDYYVTQTVSDCESEKTRVPVSINEIPVAPVAQDQSFCADATVADLIPAPLEGAPANIASENWAGFITGTGGFSGTQILASGFAYNFTQFTHAPANGYPIARAHAVEIGIPARQVYGLISVSFELSGVGSNGSTNRAYVSKIVNNVETPLATLDLTTTLSIYTVYVNEPQTNGVIVKITKDASLLYIEIPTIEYDFHEGMSINWYDVEIGGSPLATETPLETGTYYVSQTVNGCESPRVPVEVTINEAPAAPVVQDQSFCGEATVADLVPTPISGTIIEDFNTFTEPNAEAPAEVTLPSGTWTFNGVLQMMIGIDESPCIGIASTSPGINQATSPSFSGLESVSFFAFDQFAFSPLKVIKIVNGVETLLHEFVPTATFTQYTIPVNEPGEVQIKFEKPDGPNVYIDNVTFNLNEDNSINWYDSEDSNDILANETPLESGTYYVSQTVNGCVSPRTPVEVTINEIPAAPVADAQTFCGDATVGDLDAEGTELAWYDAIDATDALTEDTQLESGTYYVEQSANDCVSERNPVEVIINEIPVAPVADAQTFCGDATVGDLVAEGTELVWYDTIDATDALTEDTQLESGTYYVEQSANDCVSERTPVEVTINEIPNAPVAQDQSFCGDATVDDLDAEGTELAWYDAIDATDALTEETQLESGTYYVEQSANDCVSERTPVEVTINEIPNAPVAQDQSFCGDATVGDLVAEGTELAWYETLDASQSLAEDTILETGTYYVSQSSGDCESVRIPIEVTINEIPNAPVAITPQEYNEGDTLADLIVDGENLTWYDEDGNILDPSTPLVNGVTYYVSQTINGCESESTPIVVELLLSIDSYDFDKFNYYPNPVKNVLNLSNDIAIKQVIVFTLAGELVMTQNSNDNKVELNLSHLATATYVVKIVTEKGIKTVKVIKK